MRWILLVENCLWILPFWLFWELLDLWMQILLIQLDYFCFDMKYRIMLLNLVFVNKKDINSKKGHISWFCCIRSVCLGLGWVAMFCLHLSLCSLHQTQSSWHCLFVCFCSGLGYCCKTIFPSQALSMIYRLKLRFMPTSVQIEKNP